MDQPAIVQSQLASGDLCRVSIMSDHQQRCAKVGIQPLQQIKNVRRRCRVQVARRLVGDDYFRIGNDCSRDTDSLLLPAGKLPRIVTCPVQQLDRFERDLNAPPSLSSAERKQQQRKLDVFVRGQNGNKVVSLKNVADIGRSPFRQAAA